MGFLFFFFFGRGAYQLSWSLNPAGVTNEDLNINDFFQDENTVQNQGEKREGGAGEALPASLPKPGGF